MRQPRRVRLAIEKVAVVLRDKERRLIDRVWFRLDLVNATVRERNDKDVSIRTGDDVRCDAEVFADHETLALGLIELVEIVGDAIRQARIAKNKMLSICIQPEPKQK